MLDVVQASICAVLTLLAGPSSTWHRAGSAGGLAPAEGQPAFPRKRMGRRTGARPAARVGCSRSLLYV
jgi:hypothetical protein